MWLPICTRAPVIFTLFLIYSAFHFGDSIKDVEDKLYEHDLVLEYNIATKEVSNED